MAAVMVARKKLLQVSNKLQVGGSAITPTPPARAQRRSMAKAVNQRMAIVLGMGIGIAIGNSIHQLAIGVALGVALGVAWAAILDRKEKAKG
jgi:hypothetical protein